MKTIFIIHGVYGFPEENWFPWLKETMEAEGYQVIIPSFPIDPENQNLKGWLRVFETYVDQANEDSIFVSHSLGTAFALKLIEQHKIASLISVAGFVSDVDNEYSKDMTSFIAGGFDFDKIRANCGNFTVIHSDNDPYVKIEKAEELAKMLGTKVILVENAGHFNSAAGYNQFPLLQKLL